MKKKDTFSTASSVTLVFSVYSLFVSFATFFPKIVGYNGSFFTVNWLLVPLYSLALSTYWLFGTRKNKKLKWLRFFIVTALSLWCIGYILIFLDTPVSYPWILSYQPIISFVLLVVFGCGCLS
ncbi:MAG: hypothetical protein IJF40_01255 [Clostridia bacterium]|nr:hypothetical protein [Clostridia bacterium]